MKFKLLTTIVAASAVWCGSALAQNLIDVSKLDGKKVFNLQGEDLADIAQVLVDPQSGQLRYVVLELNKLWQINDPEIAVPYAALQITGQPDDPNFAIKLDATKEKLSKAPRHKIGEADRLFTREASRPIYTYWSILWVDPVTTGNTAETGAGGQKQSGNASSKATGSGSTATGTGTGGTPGPSATGTSGSPGSKANPNPQNP